MNNQQEMSPKRTKIIEQSPENCTGQFFAVIRFTLFIHLELVQSTLEDITGQ